MATDTQTPNTSLATSGDNREIQVGFTTVNGFNALQRIGKAFSESQLVPPEYQGPKGLANAIIATEMAMRMGANPIMVMQNLYVVHGRPSWSAKFLIACFNTCGRFEAIQYRWTGTKNTDTWGCIAYTKELASGKVIEGPEITIGLAKAEGWSTKTGSKWKTIPELMLMYRAAAWMVNTTAPEIAMGLRTVEEEEEIGKGSGQIIDPQIPVDRRAPQATRDAEYSEEDSIASELAKAAEKSAEEVGVNEKTGEFALT